MAQVLPAEGDLRRVIGDADGAGDREVEGLGEQELLDLFRSMVLLRTYDERSVVYHGQGRIAASRGAVRPPRPSLRLGLSIVERRADASRTTAAEIRWYSGA